MVKSFSAVVVLEAEIQTELLFNHEATSGLKMVQQSFLGGRCVIRSRKYSEMGWKSKKREVMLAPYSCTVTRQPAQWSADHL